ncbi:MAG: invasion associated locus B family protein [Rhizomicrobium sp.]
MKFSYLLSGLALLALGSGAALAQAQAPAAPPAPPEVKQIGDWQVRCFPVQSPSPCDMFQQQGDERTKQRILALSIAFDPLANMHLIQIVVPLGVSVGPGVVIHSGTYASPVLPYRRCDRAGCYVERPLDSAIIDQLTHAGDTAMVKIVADDGKKYDLKVPLNGFTAAHDSMAEQAKQKAKPLPAAPAPAK